MFDGTGLEVYQPDDESLPWTLESTFGVDFNAGMMVYGKDYYFGMSVFNLLGRQAESEWGRRRRKTAWSATTTSGVLLVQRDAAVAVAAQRVDAR